jgi:hypothetical protein
LIVEVRERTSFKRRGRILCLSQAQTLLQEPRIAEPRVAVIPVLYSKNGRRLLSEVSVTGLRVLTGKGRPVKTRKNYQKAEGVFRFLSIEKIGRRLPSAQRGSDTSFGLGHTTHSALLPKAALRVTHNLSFHKAFRPSPRSCRHYPLPGQGADWRKRKRRA